MKNFMKNFRRNNSQRYDVFISYRRDGGAQYARTLQLMLEMRGYRVFLDYDELVDGQFSPKIEAAIHNSTIYMIVLSKGSMARCANEGDWVRLEIELALKTNKRLVPVNPDGTFDGIPAGVPQHIREAVESTQYSEISFGQALNATVDLMVKNRLRPYVSHLHAWQFIAGAVLLLIIAAVAWSVKSDYDIGRLKERIVFEGNPVCWADGATLEQLEAADEIFRSLRPVQGGSFMQGAQPLADSTYHENVELEFETPAFAVEVPSFYMSQYEVTVGQWNAIMRDNRPGEPGMPVTGVTFDEAQQFAVALSDLTTKLFRLPTESEWEYASRGGATPENFMYAGSDNPADVAWYAANSGGKAHACAQGDLPPSCTAGDLFNMSGNVSEWCDTPFEPYDSTLNLDYSGSMVVRGGNYLSEPYEITVTHREPAQANSSIPTLGFRIALSK